MIDVVVRVAKPTRLTRVADDRQRCAQTHTGQRQQHRHGRLSSEFVELLFEFGDAFLQRPDVPDKRSSLSS